MTVTLDKNKQESTCFSQDLPDVGHFNLRSLDLLNDIPLIHYWVNLEYAKFWGMQNTSIQEVEEAYLQISNHSKVFIGCHNTEPAFLLECYSPTDNIIGKYYDAQPGDYGMHILVAPPSRPIPGFTSHVFKFIMDFIFFDQYVKRIVVEPDVRNEKIHVLNKRAGFEYHKIIELPNKTAYLAFCTREQYDKKTKDLRQKM